MKHSRVLLFLNLLLLAPQPAWSHASEQGFVLLLPTDLYTGGGVVAVLLTVGLLAYVPPPFALGLFRSVSLPKFHMRRARFATSVASAAFLLCLIAAGIWGPRDPLSNPLPLTVWTVFWIGLVSVQGIFGTAWSWINPVSGPASALRARNQTPRLRLPRRLGRWPAVLSFALFSYILLVDPAPADPARLAQITLLYWVSALALTVVFGPRWLVQGEVFTVLMRAYGRVAFFRTGRIGMVGWQVVHRRTALSVAVLCVFLLATGSFDGLNETFWWLDRLGLNPFEFPGRSAILREATLGLVVANLGLLCVFTLVLVLGQRLAAIHVPLHDLLCRFAPTLLPIALGYHVAHYLPSFMVDGQYALVALSDPFLTGADVLGLGEFYVTTGFFNTQDSVRRIYLAQAGAIVAGHLIAVLTAHAVALQCFGTHREAVRSQLPLAGFMIAYTWFGLWLLASPRF